MFRDENVKKCVKKPTIFFFKFGMENCTTNIYRFLIIKKNLAPPMNEILSYQTDKQDVPSSILGRACRSKCTEFSVDFSETRKNMGYDQVERPPMEGIPPVSSDPSLRQSALIPQPTNQ